MERYALAKIAGFLHLYVGEEAIAVRAIAALRPDDCAISAYRDHGHCPARGSGPGKVMAELFGKATGLYLAKAALCIWWICRIVSWVAMRSSAVTSRWLQGWRLRRSIRSSTW
ncbi:MAG: thiamine pyrophosphate-dependent enzyme [Nitrospira sp.]